MSKTVLQGGRFADAQGFRFQALKRLDMGIAVMEAGLFADTQSRVFRLRTVQTLAVTSCKGVDMLMLRNHVFNCETFIYGQCRPARVSIC